MSRVVTLLMILVVMLTVVSAGSAGDAVSTPQPVRTIKDAALGPVLATGTRQAIYVWNDEPKGTIRCKGACARAWPPVILKSGAPLPTNVKGLKGDFGSIRRPDGRRQLTLGKRPLYTYAHEQPGQVLCNDVDNWFAIKVRA